MKKERRLLLHGSKTSRSAIVGRLVYTINLMSINATRVLHDLQRKWNDGLAIMALKVYSFSDGL